MRRAEHEVSGPPRWLFLAGTGLVYLWALWIWNSETCAQQLPKQAQACLPPIQLWLTNPVAIMFTLLMALYGALLWLSMSRTWKPGEQWLYFAAQGLIVAAASLLMRQPVIASSLYLAVILGAGPTLMRTRAVVAVAAVYGLVLSGIVALTDWPKWQKGGLGLDALLQTIPLYVVLLLFAAGYVAVYLHLARAHDQLAAAHARLETAHAELRASAARIEELSVLAERRRLARDLHDTLAQGLAGVMMQLEAANARLNAQRPDRAQEAVREAMAYAREALADARGAIDDLRTTPASVQELAVAVDEEIDRFTAATGIACAHEVTALAALAPAHYDHALHAIREGLTNAARHARARHVWIRAAQMETTITIEVGDDGVGCEPSGIIGQPGHYGVLGVQERARLAGGRADLLSAPGAGTTLRVTFPACQSTDATAGQTTTAKSEAMP